jgi:hypothetical protein
MLFVLARFRSRIGLRLGGFVIHANLGKVGISWLASNSSRTLSAMKMRLMRRIAVRADSPPVRATHLVAFQRRLTSLHSRLGYWKGLLAEQNCAGKTREYHYAAMSQHALPTAPAVPTISNSSSSSGKVL